MIPQGIHSMLGMTHSANNLATDISRQDCK